MQSFNQAPNVNQNNIINTFDFLSPENLARINTKLSIEEIKDIPSTLSNLTSQMC
jgi:hypothetical protein